MKTNISRTLEVKNIITINTIMKTNKYIALVLMVLGLSIGSQVLATNMVLQGTGFQAVKTKNGNTNTVNTWSPYTSSDFGTCTTTANGVTITSSKMKVKETYFIIQEGKSFTISVASGGIYRIVFKPKTSGVGGSQNALTNSNGLWSGSDTWECGSPCWGFTKGKSSVTFTSNTTDYEIYSINVYTYREATYAEAHLSTTSFTVDADDPASKSTTLTTTLGSFDGADRPYYNSIDQEGISTDDLEFDESLYSTTYSNGSTVNFDIYGYTVGTYTPAILLGRQTNHSNENYTMIALWLPFTVTVEDGCTTTPTLAFATTGTINKKLGDASFTNAATSTPGTGTTGQTITYSSSDNEVATVNSSGQVTLGSKCGSTTITAAVESNGTYCSASTTYTLNLSGYSVTFHYPTCAESSPSNLTNQYGSLSLETDMAVDGYSFAGWTDHAVTTNPSSVTPLYTSSVSVSANIDLYAVYMKTSSTFTLVDKGTTTPTDGEYVIVSSYSAGSTKVLTADIDNKYKIAANTGDYTITAVKTLSCQEEACIWTITAVSGGFTIRNNYTGKYLGAASGDAGSSDQKLRLESSTGDYTTWTLSRALDKVPFTTTNNKRNSDSETRKNLMCSGDYYAFYSSGTNPYLFKRGSASGTYTSNPDCDAKEYKVTIQQQDGGSVTASASANGTWSDPVLSGMHGSETITLNATPDSYHNFSSWTVVSGGVTLSSTTTATATFTMPTSDVVIRPNYTPKSYTVTYKDKGNNAYSGDAIASSYNTYTYGVGLTLPEVTKTDWVFMGWYAETDCSGSRVTSISTSDYGDKIFYALWMQYSDPLAWCPEPEVHLTGDNVYVTSTNGKSIMAVNQLTLNAINLVPGSTVRLSTPASSGIMFSKSGVKYNATEATIDFTADAGGDITDETVYVHYYPTTAGSGTPADITVTATYQTNTDYYSTRDVHVRNMPSAFVIAAKAGGSWYALPANIANATNPAGVMIDVDESTWTAKGPSTLAYELWPVKSTTGDADRYATLGEKIRFSGNSNKGLWASTSTNTLNNNAAISAINTGTATDNYEWNVTTAVDGSTWKYQLKMEGQSNFLDLHNDASGLIWGSYSANVASDELYLIPLTPIEPITMKVVEWYPTKVLVKTANDISGATVSINGTPVDKTITKKSGVGCELYEISGLTTLTSNPTKTLTVSYTSGSTYAASVKIPVIIWESQNLVNPSGDPVGGYKPLNEPFASLTKEVYSYADLVVRDGATLTINGTSPQNTFYDVTIYPTSKISVPETNANGASNVFNIHSLTFFGGIDDIYNGSTYTVNKYGVPELSLKGRFGTKTVSTINYDMRVDDRQMYSLTVPYDVDLADITYWDGTSMGTLGDKLWVSAYDGQARANKDMAHTWVYEVNFESKFGEAKLKRGTGYTISADYQASMGNQTTIIRLPMKSNVAAGATEAAKTVPVTAYVNTQGVTVGDNNKGWNLVGNPYMVTISGGEPGSQLVIGKLVESGTGPWDWDGTTYPYRYVTIPNDNGTDYSQMKFKDATLRPFKNFFVQIDNTTEGSALGFALASRQDAPSRFLQVAEREVEVEILLSNGERQDNMGLLIAEQYSPAYEINADLEKMIGSMAVYTIYGGYNLAYNALSPDDAKQFIPVGYVAPSAGEYTFSIDDDSDVNAIDHIYLTDYQENVTVDLMEKNYSFTTVSGKNESRFALNATLKDENETPTDIDIINSGGDLNADAPQKFIYHDKMFIYHRGVIYDATGKRVKEINK